MMGEECRYGGMEAWRYGGMEAWRLGGMEVLIVNETNNC